MRGVARYLRAAVHANFSFAGKLGEKIGRPIEAAGSKEVVGELTFAVFGKNAVDQRLVWRR